MTDGRVVVMDKNQDSSVKSFLSTCESATVYHTPEWRDALVSTYNYEPFYLGYLEGADLRGLMPLMYVKSWITGRRLVSLPFANTCGPVGLPAAVDGLLGKALDLRHDLGAKALEVRTQVNLNPISDPRFARLSYFITSIVNLDGDPGRVWSSFKDRNVRTEVRQAAKKGIEVRDATGEDDLKQFYGLFSRLRLRHGVPPQSYAFFRNLWEHLWPQYLHLHVATYKDKHVAGLITLGYGATLCAAYIGSDPAYRSYRVHQILFWKAMEMGCLKGYRAFDFLRTPKDAQELRYFKDRWNAHEIDLEYLYHPLVCGTASTVEETVKYRVMTRLLKRAPDFAGRGLGRLLYRHLG
jgi:hypothetical protein